MTRDAQATVAAFLLEVEAVCRRHGLVLSHSAGHGQFEVEDLGEAGEGALAYLMAARPGETLSAPLAAR